jgi:RNA-directed DNA polymerase
LVGNQHSTEKAAGEWEGRRADHDLPPKLSSLRRALYLKAKQEPTFRFYALYDRIYRKDTLAAAWAQVRKNKGSAGVDGLEIAAICAEEGGEEKFLAGIESELKEHRYRPMRVRRVYIPKPDGRKRPLGIPTVKDRVVQMAVLLILEPIFEAEFLDCSYGFRPGKSAHDALKAVRRNLDEGYCAVYDADLKGYFDSIPHGNLMKCVEKRVSDRSVLKLIRLWLKTPVEERQEGGGGKTTVSRPTQGTPQGGVISPLLANLYLHCFDKLFHCQSGPAAWAKARLIRYADDYVVMARYVGDRIVNWIDGVVEGRMRLAINREKTRTVDMKEKGSTLGFLGYTIRRDRDRHGRGTTYLHMCPSAKAVKAEKAALRELTDARWGHLPLPDLIGRVNRNLVGWANYFSLGYPSAAYRDINVHVQQRLMRHLQRRSQRGYSLRTGETAYGFLKRMGLVYL